MGKRTRRIKVSDTVTAADVAKVMRVLGRQGGQARAKALTPAQRRQIARQGGLAKAKAARQRAKGTK